VPITVTITNASGSRYRGKTEMTDIVKGALKGHKVTLARVDIILLNDRDIRRLNKKYLQHDYATDVITFPIDDEPLFGEIYISLDTARRQAHEEGVGVVNELCRLAVHGALHLLGHDDTTDEQRRAMQKLENRYLSRL